jgi:hypothetical protein
MTSRANAMVHRVIANPERAKWDPEGMESTASLKLVTFVIACSGMPDRVRSTDGVSLSFLLPTSLLQACELKSLRILERQFCS